MSYRYLGDAKNRQPASAGAGGALIGTPDDLRRFLEGDPDAAREGATYIVDLDGNLRLAPRRSEHVDCARGEPVLAAGEMLFRDGAVVEATNQSTGYCPDPDCWPEVARALERAGLRAPNGFSRAFVFRRCGECGQINLVKESWFVCASCGADL